MSTTIAALALASTMGTAIVVQDQAPLRAAPRDAAHQQTVLWQGDMLEVRGERLDYLQVWDHRRERGGYIRASEVRRVQLADAQAPELLHLLRFVRDTPGQESLAIGLAAAYVQAAPAQALAGADGAQAMDALGTAAERLARRASVATAPAPGSAAPSTSATARATLLSGHLEVANGYGVKFVTYETQGRMQVCYDGDAFRRVLTMAQASAEQRARAALALTRPDCANPDLTPVERTQLLDWQAQVLDQVDATALPGYQRNRVHLRRASVWSALAFQQARKDPASTTTVAHATRALTEFSSVAAAELTDADKSDYNDAAMRISAVRWALVPASPAAPAGKPNRPMVVLQPGAPGQTCVLLVDAKTTADQPLARRCTYGVVWPASASLSREGNALALAVQPLEGWREMWLLRKTPEGWVVDVLPPAAATPETGYAEFAGWVPGGQRVLVAREARAQGRYRRTFEVLQIDGLHTEHQSGDVAALPMFQRWQDPAWKRHSLSLR